MFLRQVEGLVLGLGETNLFASRGGTETLKHPFFLFVPVCEGNFLLYRQTRVHVDPGLFILPSSPVEMSFLYYLYYRFGLDLVGYLHFLGLVLTGRSGLIWLSSTGEAAVLRI